MTITINMQDANNDGIGIDFEAYLNAYDAGFTQGYWGFFNDPAAGPFSGNEYAFSSSTQSNLTTPISSSHQSVIVESGASNLNYNFGTHNLEGSVDAINFGHGLSHNAATDSYGQANDIAISGLGLSGTGAGDVVHNFVYDLMQGNTAQLNSLIQSNDLHYVSSTGNDVMYGYSGDDTFAFQGGNGHDVVKNFSSGNDTVDMSATGITGMGDIFIWYNSGNATIFYGESVANSITLEGISSGLSASDFVFAPTGPVAAEPDLVAAA